MNVYLPKFRLDTEYSKMKETLQAMGMVRAFNDPRNPENGAKFNGISVTQDPEQMLYISGVFHKAFVEVNEKGTEAAAATAVAMAAAMSMPSSWPFTPTFRADKPFLFAIRDVKTGTILFLGRVTDPSANGQLPATSVPATPSSATSKPATGPTAKAPAVKRTVPITIGGKADARAPGYIVVFENNVDAPTELRGWRRHTISRIRMFTTCRHSRGLRRRCRRSRSRKCGGSRASSRSSMTA